jgi:hypothetical protein
MLQKGLGFARDNVIGLLALFVALGGTTYAATRSSGGTLHACVGANGSLTLVKAGKRCGKGARAIAWNQTGPAGPVGPQGPSGTNGTPGTNGTNGTNAASKVVVRSTTVTIAGAGAPFTGDVQCDAGERATGGGAGRGYQQPTSSTDRMLLRSYPLDIAGHEATGGETPTGWSVTGDTTGLGGNAHIYVVCVSP